MSSTLLQASSGLRRPSWHGIDWAGCYRRVRSLQRRIVQAVQAGAWRKVKRLSYLLVHSFAARALAVKRVTENTGKKTAGVDGERWETPEQKAAAVIRIGQWCNYQPQPLKRLVIPKKNGKQRLLSIPTMEDRARQAVYLQALQPIAETQADPNSYGFRPKRRCADAIEQCFKALRQKDSATGILEGDIQGFFDHIAFSWIEAHTPMNKQILAKWLRCGVIDRGALYPTTAGVPQGGIISPVISNLVLDGLEAIVQGSSWHRSIHNINYVRWADDVRHITWRQIPFTERRGSEDKTFGSTTYLEAKAEGDSSMSLKRRASEGVYGAALQDPRDTVRATLPKPQFPAMEAYIPCLQRLLAGSPR
jgi:RNA-directed DNA polymerase